MPTIPAISERQHPRSATARPVRTLRRPSSPLVVRSASVALILAFALGGALSLTLAADSRAVRPDEATLRARMAREGTNSVTLFLLADLFHDRGADGDKEAVPRAEATLRQLLASDPTNAPALALLGSVFTLKGRDAFWPLTQIRLVKEGNRMMDDAVRLAPQDPHTRILRALNNAHMPDFLGRTEIVREDLAWLWDRLKERPAGITVSQHQDVALHWGRQLKRMHRLDEARQVWETGRDLAPRSSEASAIAAELMNLR